jgi:hypothetical protein
MALELLKEQIAYLKFWQGIVVVTAISLLGWLVSAVDTAPRHRVVLAFLGIVLLTLGSIALHRQIDRRINEIGQLSPWKYL